MVGDGRSDGVQRLYMASSDGLVYVFSYSPPGVAEDASTPPITRSLLTVSPDPFSQATLIQYKASADGRPRTADNVPTYQHINLSIYDLSGRLIRTLVDEPLKHPTIEPSDHVVWDGRDEAGERVVSGVYFCRLGFGSEIAAKKVVVLR